MSKSNSDSSVLQQDQLEFRDVVRSAHLLPRAYSHHVLETIWNWLNHLALRLSGLHYRWVPNKQVSFKPNYRNFFLSAYLISQTMFEKLMTPHAPSRKTAARMSMRMMFRQKLPTRKNRPLVNAFQKRTPKQTPTACNSGSYFPIIWPPEFIKLLFRKGMEILCVSFYLGGFSKFPSLIFEFPGSFSPDTVWFFPIQEFHEEKGKFAG